MVKIKAHTCYLGKSGYSYHSRNFFRNLSKNFDLKIRNFTWDDDLTYLEERDYKILNEITLTNPQNELEDFYFKDHFRNNQFVKEENFIPDIDIVLMETDHYYFYQTDKLKGKIKIAYTVWESTELPENFLNHLKDNFHYIWVVTSWHKKMLIEQGVDPSIIFIVNEGVNPDFYPSKYEENETFDFLLFGRWDYRKSIKEIIRAFNEEFKNEDNVKLKLNVDNPFAIDGLKTTEKRLKYYNLKNKNIDILHFLKRGEYIDYIKRGNVFLSCARSEGWNIPLIEAMASGTPCIYSNYGAQLEFANNKGIPVNISGMKKCSEGINQTFNNTVGEYCEPDFEDLKLKMREVYENYTLHKEKALRDSKEIRNNFNWNKIANKASSIIYDILSKTDDNLINVNYINGARVELIGNKSVNYNVKFIDQETNEIIHEGDIKNGWWIKTAREYYTNWKIIIENIDDNYIKDVIYQDFKNKRVYISFESKSLGDTLAWIPYVEEFRKKHNCEVICSTFLNNLFENVYPKIKFIKPGEVVYNIVAHYKIGWFYDNDLVNNNLNPNDFKKHPLQKTASDILGLDFKEMIPNIFMTKKYRPIEKKYVTIAIHSTAQSKYWNHPNGWQIVVDNLRKNGYEVVLLSKEEDGYMGNKNPKGVIKLEGSLSEVAEYIKYSEFFIGIGSGLSWLAWATNIPIILISGFSDTYTEFNTSNVYRVINKSVCNSCFNKNKLDAGDWNWCPEHKGTDRQFECTKKIHPQVILDKINEIRTTKLILEDSNELLITDNKVEILGHVDNEYNIEILGDSIFKDIINKNMYYSFPLQKEFELKINDKTYYKSNPKIKIVHLQTTENLDKEQISSESLKELKNISNFKTIKNELYKGEVPKVMFNYELSEAHYGCFLSFKEAILNEFDEDIDLFVILEGDCILEKNYLEFYNKIKNVYTYLINSNIGYFSFGDKYSLDTRVKQSNEKLVINDISIVDKIIGIQSIVFPNFSRNYLIEKLNEGDWCETDIYFNVIFNDSEYNLGIVNERYTTQADGWSFLDKSNKEFK
jgi:autotransporter strand-loop-strand O-heptosyltransferase